MGLISRVSSRTYRIKTQKMKQEHSQLLKKIDINKSLLLEYSKQRDKVDKSMEDLVEILKIELDYENKLVQSDYTGPVPDHFLENPQNIDILNCSLVDASGFPLPNVNLPLVTESRGKLRTFQNDRKVLSEKIESVLYEYHSLIKQKKQGGDNQQEEQEIVEEQPQRQNPSIASSLYKPFLVVNSVTENSPASFANLQLYDKIVKFGDIRHENFIGLRQIGEYVSQNENNALTVAFIRDSDHSNVVQFGSLVPKKWDGRGLLG